MEMGEEMITIPKSEYDHLLFVKKSYEDKIQRKNETYKQEMETMRQKAETQDFVKTFHNMPIKPRQISSFLVGCLWGRPKNK